MWKDLSIAKKLGVSFGVVLILLAITGLISFTGIGTIVSDAEQVIDGNKLDSTLAQKEVDHLNWANKVSALLTDVHVTELTVQTDDHQCAFGQWLYGEGRKEAEIRVPSLAPLLKEIEKTHADLHASAVAIKKQFIQADPHLPEFFIAREVDHLKWVGKIRQLFISNLPELKVQTDHHKCALGKFLYGEKGKQVAASDPELARLIEELKGPHKKLHASAIKIQKAWKQKEFGRNDIEQNTIKPSGNALQIFNSETLPALKDVSDIIAKMNVRAKAMIGGMTEANHIFTSKTLPNLHHVQKILDKVRYEARQNIMTDKVMLQAAQGTKRNVSIMAVFAILTGIAVSLLIARAISRPLIKGVNFAKTIAEGDLTQQLDIHQKDEIGVLAQALNEMGANLRKMFKDISTGVQTLSSASTELSAISSQMSANSEQTTDKANGVAAAAEEMSVNMNSVAAASEETSVNVNMVAAAAEEMSATITEIATNTEKTSSITNTAVTQAQNASDQIQELGTAAQEIGQVTEAITEISEQTNLLALNATIEAARAGEAGKGFAVVANEIKDLAKQTSAATGEIKDKISKIQNATGNSVTEITSISGVINEVNEMVTTISITVEEQASATQEIADSVAQASQGIQEVNENVAQASSVTGEVATDIANVGQHSNEINESSSQVSVSAEELSVLAERLTGMVKQFKV